MTDDNPQAVPLVTVSRSTALMAYHALQDYLDRSGEWEPEDRKAIEKSLYELEPLIEPETLPDAPLAAVCVYCGNETVNTFPSQVPLCAWHETPDMFL